MRNNKTLVILLIVLCILVLTFIVILWNNKSRLQGTTFKDQSDHNISVKFEPFVKKINNQGIDETFLDTDPARFFKNNGYECSIDCTGHIAGYEFAKNNNLIYENDCSGDSQSFAEGCKTFVKLNDESH